MRRQLSRMLLTVILLATCGSEPDDADGQVPTDSATVDVVAALQRVTILPRTYGNVQVGDTLTFSSWGIDTDGDTIPVGGSWFSTNPSVLQLLNATGDTVRAVAVSKGRARVSIDAASIVRLDIDSLVIGFMPADRFWALWSELSWHETNIYVGEFTRACAYAYQTSRVIWMSDGSGCPDPDSNLGSNRLLPLVPGEWVGDDFIMPTVPDTWRDAWREDTRSRAVPIQS